MDTDLPAVGGGVLALLAATFFGISTPSSSARRWLGCLSTTALRGAGAAIVAALLRHPPNVRRPCAVRTCGGSR